MTFKARLALLFIISYASMFIYYNNCLAQEEQTLKKETIIIAIKAFNEKKLFAVDIGKNMKTEKLKIQHGFSFSDNTIEILYNFLKRHRLASDFLDNNLNRIIVASINKAILEIEAEPNVYYSFKKSRIREHFSTEQLNVVEFGLFEDIPLIKKHLVFYLVISPDIHTKIQYDIALDERGHLEFLESSSNMGRKTSNGDYVHINKFIESFNRFIASEKLFFSKDNI